MLEATPHTGIMILSEKRDVDSGAKAFGRRAIVGAGRFWFGGCHGKGSQDQQDQGEDGQNSKVICFHLAPLLCWCRYRFWIFTVWMQRPAVAHLGLAVEQVLAAVADHLVMALAGFLAILLALPGLVAGTAVAAEVIGLSIAEVLDWLDLTADNAAAGGFGGKFEALHIPTI
jgi:hypothetical protein